MERRERPFVEAIERNQAALAPAYAMIARVIASTRTQEDQMTDPAPTKDRTELMARLSVGVTLGKVTLQVLDNTLRTSAWMLHVGDDPDSVASGVAVMHRMVRDQFAEALALDTRCCLFLGSDLAEVAADIVEEYEGDRERQRAFEGLVHKWGKLDGTLGIGQAGVSDSYADGVSFCEDKSLDQGWWRAGGEPGVPATGLNYCHGILSGEIPALRLAFNAENVIGIIKEHNLRSFWLAPDLYPLAHEVLDELMKAKRSIKGVLWAGSIHGVRVMTSPILEGERWMVDEIDRDGFSILELAERIAQFEIREVVVPEWAAPYLTALAENDGDEDALIAEGRACHEMAKQGLVYPASSPERHFIATLEEALRAGFAVQVKHGEMMKEGIVFPERSAQQAIDFAETALFWARKDADGKNLAW